MSAVPAWFQRLSELAEEERPDVDRAVCGWSDDTKLVLAERFINQMGLWPLYEKFLDIEAEEELGGDDDDLGIHEEELDD